MSDFDADAADAALDTAALDARAAPTEDSAPAGLSGHGNEGGGTPLGRGRPGL